MIRSLGPIEETAPATPTYDGLLGQPAHLEPPATHAILRGTTALFHVQKITTNFVKTGHARLTLGPEWDSVGQHHIYAEQPKRQGVWATCRSGKLGISASTEIYLRPLID